MRSILTRSAVAIATLAIGSAALAASPATAATASGVTRDMVLTAANGARAAEAAAEEEEGGYQLSDATERAAFSILNRSCNLDSDGVEHVDDIEIYPTAAGGNADGVLLKADVESDLANDRECVVAAIATTDASFSLAGTASFDGMDYYGWSPRAQAVTSLSGDVYVTTPLPTDDEGYVPDNVSFSATGNAVKDTSTTTTKRVPDVKTAFEKRKANEKYDNRIAKAKKSYAKALDKAGDSKSKKSAAKKAYRAKRSFAKAQLARDLAGFKDIQQTTVNTQARPFYVSAAIAYYNYCSEECLG